MLKNPTALLVLVVDDEALMRWAIAATLAECGHRVVEAADSAAAIRALTDGTAAPDVMLVDCRLSSDSDDLSLIATLRRLSPKSAVVLMTAFGTREVVEDVQALGVCHVMHKPFDLRDIACAVEHAQDRERRTSRSICTGLAAVGSALGESALWQVLHFVTGSTSGAAS